MSATIPECWMNRSAMCLRRLGVFRTWLAVRRTMFAMALIMPCVLPRATNAEELVIPGSGNPEHVLTILADAFNRQQTRHRVVIPTSTGTAGAIRDVEAMTAHLGRVGRPLTEIERARGLVYVPFGRDPVTFVAGAAVIVSGLTTRQIIDAYTGKITDWKDLGGNPGPIRAIGRESTDASRRAINRGITPFETIAFGDHVKIVHLDPQMIALLDRFPTSLGFLNRSALGAARTALVHLTLDGVPAAAESVQMGRYPLWIEVGLIHRAGSLIPSARAFIGFIRSTEGMAILRAQGLLGIPDQSGQRG